MTVTGWLEAGIYGAIDFVYPRSCRWCRTLLPDDSGREESFCGECILSLAPLMADRCRRCSAPVGPNLETSEGCLHCRRHPRSYQSVISLGPYVDELRQACLACKGARHSALASALTDLLGRRHGDILRSWNCDLVVPVPHFWLDRIWRDDPSAMIGERLSRLLHLPLVNHSLRKVRFTRKQHKLPASARESNLTKAFRVRHPSRLKGKRILLVDDVLTTGITADRCTRTLQKAGAAEVHVAVLARSIRG